MKRGCLIPLIASLLALCVVGALVAGYFALQTPAAQPLVLINSPHNGARVAVDEETIIQAVARGDAAQKIKRVELWVDGRLQDAQSSDLPGGISPFPIVATWQPPAPGAHTFIVRAFNTQGRQGQGSINVEAVQSGDRDGDGVPDALDGCPDQPGLATNNGCPVPTTGDRDGDGVPDATDVCPDQPGTTQTQGCPDADGDGVRDGVDACPREFGTAERNGCPAPGDADGDGVPDTSDACPGEAGSAALAGCPDRDGDGVRDGDDACPDVPGLPGLAGCPDGDGDGVRDVIDLCPTVAGPASNAGCPPTGSGDSDGDGVDNSTDLNPGEAGSADSGGAPPPGGGVDGDGDGIVDAEEPTEDPVGGLFGLFPGLFSRAYAMTTAEVQALEFQVSQDYDDVYCYATLAGGAEERIGPFAPLGARRWDIANYLGPLNSRTLFVAQGLPLEMRLECSALVAGPTEVSPSPGGGVFGAGGGEATYFDLGSISRSHSVGRTTTIEETVDSTGGMAGHTFRVKYRLCSPSCAVPVLPAPQIRLTHVSSVNMLWWEWPGNWYDISGFRMYVNGTSGVGVEPRRNFYSFHDVPPCGHNVDIQLTAYRGNPSHPDAESPRSNIQTWEVEPCSRTVLVSFERFETGDLRGLGPAPGPIYGTLWAGDEGREFDSDTRVEPNHSYPATDFTPRTDFTVELEPEDSLFISARFVDWDPGRGDRNDEVLFDREEIIPPAEIRTGERTITGRGNNRVVVYITVPPGP